MNSPQAQTLRAEVMREQANHIQAMNERWATNWMCRIIFW